MKSFKQIKEEINEGRKAVALALVGAMSVHGAHALKYTNRDRMSKNVIDARSETINIKDLSNANAIRNIFNHKLKTYANSTGKTVSDILKDANLNDLKKAKPTGIMDKIYNDSIKTHKDISNLNDRLKNVILKRTSNER